MTPEAYDAVEILHNEGISCELIDLKKIKPISEEMILKASEGKRLIVCCEEGVPSGGVSSQIGMILARNRIHTAYICLNIGCENIVIGTRNENLALQGMDCTSIAKRIAGEINNSP